MVSGICAACSVGYHEEPGTWCSCACHGPKPLSEADRPGINNRPTGLPLATLPREGRIDVARLIHLSGGLAADRFAGPRGAGLDHPQGAKLPRKVSRNVYQMVDRAKLPSRESEIKVYRFRQRLHQAISLARVRLRKAQALKKTALIQLDPNEVESARPTDLLGWRQFKVNSFLGANTVQTSW
jgi:hypothetical protein